MPGRSRYSLLFAQFADWAEGLPSEAPSGGPSPKRSRWPLLGVLALGILVGALVTTSLVGTGTGPTDHVALAASSSKASQAGMAQLTAQQAAPTLAPATVAPVPAPASVADEAPLQSHEVFGFAPYWTLPQASGYDLAGLTTLAYFSIGVNPDGSLDTSGSGWAGYQSQDLSDLITRAHAAGDRVVLTVNCFDQGALDSLTSSATAPATLAQALISAVEAKNLDGVNIDFEGEGSGDQAGLTNLITVVSDALHQVNPHWQVTMDTYASSAGDPGGFYDIKALAPVVDGFFVMAYELNLAASAQSSSPLTSSMFSNQTAAAQYAAAVPADKVILGLPFYGYDWPTTDGTLDAQATGGATPVTYGQVVASGHPIYWDSVTQTAWTSYQDGSQWHETFFEDPTSLYLDAQLAQSYGLAGVGIWALGMDDNDPAMVAALDGYAPAVKDSAPGPDSTSPSPSGASASPAPSSTAKAPSPPRSTGHPTTTTTAPEAPSVVASSGTWLGQVVSLTKVGPKTLTPDAKQVGQLTGFTTTDPSLACLEQAGALQVYRFGASPKLVVMAEQPGDCLTASFVFDNPDPTPSTTTTTAPTGTTTVPPVTTTVPPVTTTTAVATVTPVAGTTTP